MSLGVRQRMSWWRKPTGTSRRSTPTWRGRYPATTCWRWPKKSDHAKLSPSACQADGSARARSSSRQCRQRQGGLMHMVDGSEHEGRPGSFYASPEEAARAAPEKLLYLACLHEGT